MNDDRLAQEVVVFEEEGCEGEGDGEEKDGMMGESGTRRNERKWEGVWESENRKGCEGNERVNGGEGNEGREER